MEEEENYFIKNKYDQSMFMVSSVDKVKIPIASILSCPWLACHYIHMGNMLIVTLYEELHPVLWVAWLQESRGWSGGTAEDRD